MRTSRARFCSAAMLALLGASLPAAAAMQQWHFSVVNKTDSPIVRVLTSQNQNEWGVFDMAGGVAPGATATLTWEGEAGDPSCTRWIRADFADGSQSPASQQNFCADLASPIEFTR